MVPGRQHRYPVRRTPRRKADGNISGEDRILNRGFRLPKCQLLECQLDSQTLVFHVAPTEDVAMRTMNSVDLREAGNGLYGTDRSAKGGDSGPSYAGASCGMTSSKPKTDATAGITVPLSAVVPAWPRVFPGL